jgi:TP901 family phage tail tape measure protein
MTSTLTVPIVAAAAAGVSKFAEFDKTMTLVNQTMGNSAEEADLLRAAIDSAAAQSTFSMADAATAVLNFARAGLDAEQAAQTLAPAMNLAAGAGGELDTVSAGLVATINGFGDSFANASSYADIFAAACNNSALDVNSLSSAMSIAAPIFRTAGYSVNDAALYMGVMANNGIDANTAANALKTGIARLASPTSDAADMMSKLGLEIFNADGSMKDSLTVQRMLQAQWVHQMPRVLQFPRGRHDLQARPGAPV